MRLKSSGNGMFAFDAGQARVFLYNPADGLDIPLLLALHSGSFTVEYPSGEDIERNFRIYPTIEALIENAPEFGNDIDLARRVNLTYSQQFASMIARDDTTLESLALAISEALNQNLDAEPVVEEQAIDAFDEEHA